MSTDVNGVCSERARVSLTNWTFSSVERVPETTTAPFSHVACSPAPRMTASARSSVETSQIWPSTPPTPDSDSTARKASASDCPSTYDPEMITVVPLASTSTSANPAAASACPARFSRSDSMFCVPKRTAAKQRIRKATIATNVNVVPEVTVSSSSDALKFGAGRDPAAVYFVTSPTLRPRLRAMVYLHRPAEGTNGFINRSFSQIIGWAPRRPKGFSARGFGLDVGIRLLRRLL